ncbi:MAG: hypothetical protein QXG11_03970 [Candidatus Bathyarchaeia archaeon]
MPWEISQNYIRSGHRRLDEFEPESLRNIVLSEAEGVRAVVGKPKGKDAAEIVSYLFDVSKGWTIEKAKEWFSQHCKGEVSRCHKRLFAVLPFQVLERIVDKPLRIRGIAVKVGVSRNKNIYTAEELEAFASKLVGAPVYIEHVAVPNAVGKVTKAWFDGQSVWYEAEIYDDEIAEKIRKGLIQHVSVGADYETLDIVDGRIPRGLHNAELSLVAVPGIPETNIQVLESLQRADTPACVPVSRDTPRGGNVTEKGENKPPVLAEKIFERVWTTRYKNDLPDDAFALILPGGEKDETGRTKPRSLRLFPYKNAQGKVDLPHLRNANARVSQMIKGSIPRGQATIDQLRQAQRKLVAVKKKLGVGAAAEEMKLYEEINADEEVPEKIEALPEPTSDEFLQSLEDVLDEMWSVIEDLQARVQTLEQQISASQQVVEKTDQQQAANGSIEESLLQLKESTIPISKVVEMFESVLPSPIVERSWGLGPQRMCQDIRRIIWKLKERSV